MKKPLVILAVAASITLSACTAPQVTADSAPRPTVTAKAIETPTAKPEAPKVKPAKPAPVKTETPAPVEPAPVVPIPESAAPILPEPTVIQEVPVQVDAAPIIPVVPQPQIVTPPPVPEPIAPPVEEVYEGPEENDFDQGEADEIAELKRLEELGSKTFYEPAPGLVPIITDDPALNCGGVGGGCTNLATGQIYLSPTAHPHVAAHEQYHSITRSPDECAAEEYAWGITGDRTMASYPHCLL